MYTLKRILIAVIISFILFLQTANFFPVSAQTDSYARILSNSIYIYQDQSLQEPMFAVPYSYYVKVEERTDGVVRVSYGDGDYPKIYGFMKESELSFVDYVPTSPYSVIKVSTDISDILWSDAELKTPYFNVPKNEILYYYGEIEKNDVVTCFVYYSKKLGYVDKASLNPFSITPNPDPLPEIDGEQEENPPDTESATKINPLGEHIQVIIIVGISIVSISVVYFLFKPSKNKTEEEA
ncbi:MAG: hypothetical protein IJA97_01375 [Clostridia bacterium]|nr:hypothetical protein [Clostridia bacterium]